ncbi:GNAT family N-acetyltransferase [Peribacillus muralis]|uniref:GNAT family N-acetyltransferase n=1 Tax=Peribacillus muralis TaxID=264697 RepID=UPI00366CF9DE
MNVHLKGVTRENWEEALSLKVKEQHITFVPSVAVSLAKVYIKPDGDNIVYVPFAIYDKELMVGFIMHAYDAKTTNMYWINGFMIDASYQGKGYGRAALSEMVHWITNKFTNCKEIRLTVFKDNVNACELYKSFGFLPTGDVYGEEDVWVLPIK